MDVRRRRRIMPLLLQLLASSFLTRSLADESSTSGLHPVVLLPGYSCSKIDARLTGEYQPPSAMPRCGTRKGKGWFRLWEDYAALQEDPTLVRCYADQLRLVYDPVARDYRDVPGVETRVVAFGTIRGFGTGDPAQKNDCMERLVEALEGVGYREGKNLFGAPYDFRYAPAAPGEASKVFSFFLSSLRLLVERASKMNGNKPVILVTHSLGGFNTLEFLNRNPLPWRRRYVKHFVMLSVGIGGRPLILQLLASDTSATTSPVSNVLSFANTRRSFVSLITFLPSPKVFGHKPLVITRAKNYSAYDIPEFLTAVGFSDGEVERYRTRALPVILNLRAPAVPMTCVNSIGLPTIDKLVYLDGDFGAVPEVVYGDGDGIVHLRTVLALDTVIGGDPNQRYFKSILIPNVTHNGMIADDFALKRVVTEILEANQASS